MNFKALIYIFILWLFLLFMAVCFIDIDFSKDEFIAIASICFIFSWWSIYYASPKLDIPTLRNYLEQHRINSDSESIEKKSRSMTTTIALCTTVMSIFLSIVLRYQDNQLCPFQMFLKLFMVHFAFLTILLFIFAIDILDTVVNKFSKKDRIPEIDKKDYFYRKIGNVWPKGGSSYAYIGYSLISVLLFMFLSFFYTKYIFCLLAVFVYLGYPIFYGYYWKVTKYNGKQIFLNKKSICHLFTAVVIIGTIYFINRLFITYFLIK